MTEQRQPPHPSQEAELFRLVIENTRDYAIFVLDLEGRFLTWNPGVERVLGYGEAEFIGQRSHLIFTPEDVTRGEPEKETAEARSKGRAEDDRWHVRKDGTHIWCSGVMMLLRDEAGQPRALAKIVRDFTSQKQAADELQRLVGLAERRAAELNAVIASMPDAVYIGTADGITLCNANALRMLGLGSADELRQPIGKLGAHFNVRRAADGRPLEPDDLQFMRALQGETITEEVVATKADDGTEVFIRSAAAPVRQNDRIVGAVVVNSDITETKRAELALRESREYLEVALAAAAMGTWRWDVPMDRDNLDENLRRLMGLPAGAKVETLGDFLNLIHPEDQGAVRAAFEHSVTQGTELAVEFRVAWPDGSIHWLRDQGKLFRGPDGRPQYLTGACVDITERKRMEETLRQRAEELAEADRRKDEFLAMLGHELRNPLAPIRSTLEVLRMQNDMGPRQERAYARIDRQVAHLTRLVDDLLDVSRITRGKVELHAAPLELATSVHHAVEMARPLIDARSHHLMISLPDRPVWVNADETRLTQVLFNLLSNAAKYTDAGGRIWLTAERENGQVVLRVRDTGMGMTRELLPKVFDVFAQGERTLDRSQGGLGLGLTLVRTLIEMHGGTVEAYSPGPGKGSEFVVRLPTLPDQAPEKPKYPVASTVDGGRLRVLIVDDNVDVAESLAMLLEGLGHEVRMAHDGPQALTLAVNYQPQVILLDIGLPGMDGYEVARQMRRQRGLETVPLIAVTGYGQDEDRGQSRDAGFDHHLVKPVGQETLRRLINEMAPVATHSNGR